MASRAEPRTAIGPGRSGKVRVGISGWTYPEWRGTFYPRSLVQRRHLEFASRALPTIELNGSFYSLQRPESYQRWHDETPRDFVFSVKAPRFITHIKRLRDIDAPLANFLASGLANLDAKLGPILWQLPPTLHFDPELLDAFLALLPHDATGATHCARRHDGRVEGRAQTTFPGKRRLRHALEVRHASFVDPRFIRLLRRHGVALVIADTAGRWPEFEDVTADFVYVRLHGASALYKSGYSESQLAQWAARIACWRRGAEPAQPRRILDEPARARRARDVFCYFDNTMKVHAPANARRLLQILGEPPARAFE
jgi:uncharacterized protein YecE (DUF72 family)